jgi:hypothetical protein
MKDRLRFWWNLLLIHRKNPDNTERIDWLLTIIFWIAIIAVILLLIAFVDPHLYY